MAIGRLLKCRFWLTLPSRISTSMSDKKEGDLVAIGRDQASEGIDHLIINLPDVHRIEQLGTIGREVVPELATLEPAIAV